MNTGTLDRLYLEWSQFTKALTSRELDLKERLDLSYSERDALRAKLEEAERQRDNAEEETLVLRKRAMEAESKLAEQEPMDERTYTRHVFEMQATEDNLKRENDALRAKLDEAHQAVAVEYRRRKDAFAKLAQVEAAYALAREAMGVCGQHVGLLEYWDHEVAIREEKP